MINLDKFMVKPPDLLTSEYFVQFGACSEGIARFKEKFPTGILLENIRKDDLRIFPSDDFHFLAEYLLTCDALDEFDDYLFENSDGEGVYRTGTGELSAFCNVVGIE